MHRVTRRTVAFLPAIAVMTLLGLAPVGRVGAQNSARPVATGGSEQTLHQSQWHLDPTPTLVIGVAEGREEYLFTNVIDAMVLGDGSTVVGMFQRNFFELRYFDASGGFLNSAGQWGDGPFEFTSAFTSLLRLPGDSVLLVSWAHRYSVFGPGGEEVRSGRLSLLSGSYPFDLLDARYLTLAQTGYRGDQEVRGRPGETEVTLSVQDIELGTVETAGVIPGLREYVAEDGLYLHLPFEPAPTWAAGDSVLWFGDTGSGVIRGWVLEGDEQLRIQVRSERQTVTRAQRRYWKEYDNSLVSGDLERRYRAHHRGLDFPNLQPAISRLFIDELNNLWVLVYEPPYSEAPYRFEVFGPRGEPIADIAIPFSVLDPDVRRRGAEGLPRILEIGAGYMLVRDTDELGVEQVKRYRLVKN